MELTFIFFFSAVNFIAEGWGVNFYPQHIIFVIKSHLNFPLLPPSSTPTRSLFFWWLVATSKPVLSLYVLPPPQIFTYNLDLLSSFCFLPYLPLLVITLLFSVVFWRHSSGPGMGRVIWYILISIGWRLILLMLKMTMITTISWG